MERSKKKVQLWKKAIVHFSLCFVMGFFTGFAPTGKSSSPVFPSQNQITSFSSNKPKHSPQPAEMLQRSVTTTHANSNVNSSLIDQTPVTSPTTSQGSSDGVMLLETEEQEQEQEEKETNLVPRRLVIIVTPTGTRSDKSQGVFLRRIANTIKLVPPPLLWIVVEKHSDSDEISKMLRKTGVMYRRLVYKDNFTDPEAELDHQRNMALKHIEHHRLSGVVHFAGLSNVYDLGFFDELREIEVFGTWPMAILSANRQKVIIEGPVCDSSQVIGWHLKRMNNESDTEIKPQIHVSSFGFNSSILWDPERWGRPSSLQQTSQNSIKFVKQVVLEDEAKLKGIPPEDCSRIMLWSLKLPNQDSPTHHSPITAFDSVSQR